MKTICGIDCAECGCKDICKGCVETNGHPLGGECVVAECYKAGGEQCFITYKERLIEEFNALAIDDMPTITNLCPLSGAYITVENCVVGRDFFLYIQFLAFENYYHGYVKILKPATGGELND